ncbi:transmembrane protein 106B-like [Dendronephthya gigantea]|uniref:transmembrane protein 106B-like n=1 Tax=Dendronephthya gigantea TaxID=151771 RepID=UPI00106C281C|nr:transmembrane protein 106B-like [Dendronephthya gigantea]
MLLMATNPETSFLDDGIENYNRSETEDISKYEEIRDRSMRPSGRGRQNKNINLASPININSDISDVAPIVNPNGRYNRQMDREDEDESLLTDEKTLTCPTCKGTGTIYADDSSLVALIPVKDERLKPKRTKLKIAIAVCLTILICGVTIFFLFPRSPTLRLQSVVGYNSSFPTSGDAYILLKNHYVVDNKNFVYVDLTSISLSVSFQKLQVAGPNPIHKFETKSVDMRSSTDFDVYVNTTYKRDTSGMAVLKLLCMYGFLLLDISTQIESSFLFHTEMISSTKQTYFPCYYNGSTF